MLPSPGGHLVPYLVTIDLSLIFIDVIISIVGNIYIKETHISTTTDVFHGTPTPAV